MRAAPFVLSLTGLLAVLALGTGIAGRDDTRLDPAGRTMTDAVVTARESGTTDTVALRVSDPTREVTCRVPRSDFDGDWPAVGEVVPVIPGALGRCELPVVTGRLPRAQLVVTGLILAAALVAWLIHRSVRAGRRRAQDATLAAYLSRNVAR
ncbi:hypothetical protein [Actinoplanes sp. NPDC051494]|uniref:hypothetical protein n=1 Tax=Actinoplanes sp. NPDC051494 TaxID=3363907 RepID=UPI00379F4C8F